MHRAVLITKYKLTIFDTLMSLISVVLICIWIDYPSWYLNNLVVLCIGVEVAKIFRINSFILGTKVMIFNMIIDIFWSFTSQYVFPSYINLSNNSRAHTSIIKLEIPVFFENSRSYYCSSMGLIRDFIVPLVFITFFEKFG